MRTAQAMPRRVTTDRLMMMDTNSDEIAERIQAWIAARGLMR